jgi:hypothetical protein
MGLIFKDKTEAPKNDKGKKEVKVPTAASIPAPTFTQASPSSTTNPLTLDGVIDETIINALIETIKANNLPTKNYLQFMDSIDKMKALTVDEKNKYMMVYITFSSDGVTKEQLLSSIDHYVEVVKKEESNFNNELKTVLQQSVTDPNSSAIALEKDIEALTAQIKEKQAKINETRQQTQQAELNIKLKEANFRKSVEHVVKSLIADKDKINSYIQ